MKSPSSIFYKIYYYTGNSKGLITFNIWDGPRRNGRGQKPGNNVSTQTNLLQLSVVLYCLP